MARKVRKQFCLEPDQDAMLTELSRETGLSAVEIVRKAIDGYARSVRPGLRELEVWEDERAFLVRLIERGSVPGERAWRREELHE